MATASIGQRTDITPESAMEVLKHYFPRYDIYPTKIRGRDFIVKKSNWTGVGVRVKQEKQSTVFVYSAMMPNIIFQALFGGLIAFLILRKEWRNLENEVGSLIRTAAEFQTGYQAAA